MYCSILSEGGNSQTYCTAFPDLIKSYFYLQTFATHIDNLDVQRIKNPSFPKYNYQLN